MHSCLLPSSLGIQNVPLLNDDRAHRQHMGKKKKGKERNKSGHEHEHGDTNVHEYGPAQPPGIG